MRLDMYPFLIRSWRANSGASPFSSIARGMSETRQTSSNNTFPSGQTRLFGEFRLEVLSAISLRCCSEVFLPQALQTLETSNQYH